MKNIKNIKNTLFYLIGEGFLGKPLKEFLVKNNCTIITQDKNKELIPAKWFKKLKRKKEIEDIIVLYFGAPNKQKDLKKSKKLKKSYSKIAKYLSRFPKVIYANSEAVFSNYKEEKYQADYIKYNKQFQYKPNIINLHIPYIYDNKKPKKNSLYYLIKKGKKRILEKDSYKKIKIQRLDLFIIETFYKIKSIINIPASFNRCSKIPEKYNSIEISLDNFQQGIIDGKF